jgi:uncharacterized protein Usg
MATFLLLQENLGSMLVVSGTTRKETPMSDATPQIREYRLTTAEIIYHMPDHPDLLQSFIWQKLDLAPDYPALRRFLEFWSHNIEGKIHSVKVGQARFPGRGRFRHVSTSLRLH